MKHLGNIFIKEIEVSLVLLPYERGNTEAPR